MLASQPALASGHWFPILDASQAGPGVADQISQGWFCFQGEGHSLGLNPSWLQNPSADLEWHILLHKFYYAVALGQAWQATQHRPYLDTWLRLTDSWIDQVPLDFLPADVCGRRLQNWLSAWFYFQHAEDLPAGFAERFTRSVAEQAAWLRANLTPARNHRTLELLALFLVAVALPHLPEAASWRHFACHAITENIDRDFLPDGVHCELSTDYHHIVLRNALYFRRLAVENGLELPPAFLAALRRALEFSLHVHRPDGSIPSFSDGDNGDYRTLLAEGSRIFSSPAMAWVASQGQLGHAPANCLAAFPHGGYYTLRTGWGQTRPFAEEDFLLFDCGPLGEGNHGHLDLLHFEWFAGGSPQIVDPGRYTYDESGACNWRVHFRGTSAHNTVSVDGRHQTRYAFHKRKFKVQGPAPAFALLGFGQRDGYSFVAGEARSAEYDVLHQREIRLLGPGRLWLQDRLSSPSLHTYVQSFQLAPSSPTPSSPAQPRHPQLETPTLEIGGLRFLQRQPCHAEVAPGWVSPQYGHKLPAPQLRFSQTGTNVIFETEIHLLPPPGPSPAGPSPAAANFHP